MFYSPEERERIARKLRQNSEFAEEEIQKKVDKCLRLAEALLPVWSRHMARRSKRNSPESKPESQENNRSP